MSKDLNRKNISAITKRIFKYYKGTLCVTISVLGMFGLIMWLAATMLKLKIVLPDYVVSGLLVFIIGIVWLLSMSNGIISIVADGDRAKEKKALNLTHQSKGEHE